MSRFTQLALVAALLPFCASAQDAPAASTTHASFFQHMLQKMDTNGDGRISQDEFLAAATARFKSIDTANQGKIDATAMLNSPAAAERMQHRAESLVRHLDKAGNGYVTRDEVVAAAQQRFARLDRKGDGKLTPDELTGRHGRHSQAATETARSQARAQFAQRHFDKLDANHDGVVTQDEFVAAATARFQQVDTQGTGRVTASEIASSPKAAERASRMAEHVVQRLDTNGDGVVSQDEFLAAAKKRFSHMDRNGDGFIDADELPAHRWAHGGKAAPAAG